MARCVFGAVLVPMGSGGGYVWQMKCAGKQGVPVWDQQVSRKGHIFTLGSVSLRMARRNDAISETWGCKINTEGDAGN